MAHSPQPPLAFIALGSNLGDPRRNVLAALDRIQSLSDQPILRSPLLQSAPVDCPPGSPTFVNAAAALHPLPGETPFTLLAKLQSIERELGRQPKNIHNEPRVIDLDLIAFGQEIIDTPGLILPHPRAHERRFVLQPLSEIAPNLILPGHTKSVSALLNPIPPTGAVV